MAKKQQRARAWCFTLFCNWSEEYKEYVPKVIINEDRVRYIIYQLELTPSSKKYHWQGYIEFKNPISMQGVKNALDVHSIHLEMAKGSPFKNQNYCSKDATKIDGPWEFGKAEGQGCRNDIGEFFESAKKEGFGNAIRNNLETYVKFHKGLEKAWDYLYEEREYEKKEVIWIYGKTGVGKSKEARKDKGRKFTVPKCNPGKIWFDGYSDQDIIILDDLRPDTCSNDYLLQLLDGYDIQVEVKGGFRRLKASVIYITSDRSPEDFWDKESDIYYSQFIRRITEIWEMTDGGEKINRKI